MPALRHTALVLAPLLLAALPACGDPSPVAPEAPPPSDPAPPNLATAAATPIRIPFARVTGLPHSLAVASALPGGPSCSAYHRTAGEWRLVLSPSTLRTIRSAHSGPGGATMRIRWDTARWHRFQGYSEVTQSARVSDGGRLLEKFQPSTSYQLRGGGLGNGGGIEQSTTYVHELRPAVMRGLADGTVDLGVGMAAATTARVDATVCGGRVPFGALAMWRVAREPTLEITTLPLP